MLGIGNSLITAGVIEEEAFTPESINNIALWLKSNTNVEADEDSSGSTIYSPVRTSTAGNLTNSDRIVNWNGAGSTSLGARQTSSADKPRWDASENEIKFPNNAKHMQLGSEISIGINTDFTIVIRFKTIVTPASHGLMGDTSAEFISVEDADTIRFKSDGTTSEFDGGDAMETSKYQTMILVRSDGATGNINCFLRGTDSGYFDGTATGTPYGAEVQDKEPIKIEYIGSKSGTTAEYNGYISDVIVYNGTAVTAAQREQLFDYIEAAI